MRRALAGALTLAIVASALLAWSRGTASHTLVCLGDSNTAEIPSWCDLLPDLLPSDWRVINRGQGFAIVNGPSDYKTGGNQIAASLARDRPDAVVMAFGTNDLTLAFAVALNLKRPLEPALVQPVVERYAELRERARAAGARTFVALTPPIAAKRWPFGAPVNELIDFLNERLRERFPADELIDFHSPMDADADYRDAVHMNEAGQRKRARAACEALLGWIDPPSAGDCAVAVTELGKVMKAGELTPLPRASRRRSPRRPRAVRNPTVEPSA
jgi:lysophospholipase L1-like esterase